MYLELTLPFLLGPVPWLLSNPDIISTKTDKSKLPHGLQSHIEPTLDWPCSAAHNFDVNAVTTEHNSFSCHLQDSDGISIHQALKAGHVGFVIDTYIQCISSYATKEAPSECQQHWPGYGGRDLQLYTV